MSPKTLHIDTIKYCDIFGNLLWERLAEIRRLRSEIRIYQSATGKLRGRVAALRDTVKGERIMARGAERELARYGRILNEANRRARSDAPSSAKDFAELHRLAQELANATGGPVPFSSGPLDLIAHPFAHAADPSAIAAEMAL